MKLQGLHNLDSLFWIMLGCMTIPSMMGLIYLSKATKYGQVSDISPLLIFLPVLIALTGPLWHDERLSGLAWLGICVVGFGGYCLKLQSFRRPLEPLLLLARDRASRYLAVSIILALWTAELQKWMVLAYDPSVTLFFSTLAVVIGLGPLSMKQSGGPRALGRDMQKAWLWLLALGFVSAISAFAQFKAYDLGGDVATVLSIKRLSVIFICVYGFMVLREPMHRGKILGIGLMTIGGVILYLQS